MTAARRISEAWARLWRWLGSIPDDRALRAALMIWAAIALIVAIIVAVQPDRRTTTFEYQRASARWWKGEESLYQKHNGYLYLPQAAMLYSPYEALHDRVGEPLWRLTNLGLLALGILLVSRRVAAAHAGKIFLIATVLALPSMLSSARNGQVNMTLGALYLLTTVTLSDKRWWLSAILLTVALALKPISIVPFLVCGVIFPRLRIPLLLAFAAMLGSAYLHHNPAYVTGEYKTFWDTLLRAGRPKSHTWCDFAGMMRTFGLPLSDSAHLLIRAIMAPITLLACWSAARTINPMRAAFGVMLLCVVYLMLFNPRTETNSYVILGGFIGLWGAYEAVVRQRLDIAAWLVLLAAILGTENYGWPIFPLTNLWLKALATTALAVWLFVACVRRREGASIVMPEVSGSAKLTR